MRRPVTGPVVILGRAGAVVTPPLPDVDRLTHPYSRRRVIFRGLFVDGYIGQRKRDNEREVSHLQMVDAIKGLRIDSVCSKAAKVFASLSANARAQAHDDRQIPNI